MSEASAASPWVAPEFSGTGGFMTADRLEALQRTAYEEAYANGLEEGRQAGRKQLGEQVNRLTELMRYLSEPFRQLDEEVEQALMHLAGRMAERIVRREVKVDPSHIVGLVQEAVNLLPVGSRSVSVHLHPQDAAVVRQAYGEVDAELTWQLVENPALTIGDLQVITETSRIDATIEKRLADMLAGLTGAAGQDND